MKKTLSLGEFREEAYKFEDRREQFSYRGLEALFNYLEEVEEGTGEEIEFDFVALCCEFSEYEDLKDYNEQHGTEYEDIEELEGETMVILLGEDEENGFIVQDF